MFDIKNVSDFATGQILTITIPEEDIDKKALFTVIDDKPSYVVPFSYRCIDGKYEFTYHVGKLNKLLYVAGKKNKIEYLDAWEKLLEPFQSFDDWFLNLSTFVLDFDYLYANGQNDVMYIYVPSIRNEYSINDMKSMITTFAKKNTTDDMELVNEILWALSDVDIPKLLEIIKTNKKPEENIVKVPNPNQVSNPKQISVNSVQASEPVENKGMFDFNINIANQKSDPNMLNIEIIEEKKEKMGLFGKKKEKQNKIKPAKNKSEKSSVFAFGKKKEQEEFFVIQNNSNENIEFQTPNVMQNMLGGSITGENMNNVSFEDDVTMLVEADAIIGFSYIGSGNLPRSIEVNISNGEIFTIGRFDKVKGTQQSHFEFPANIKAISRCHHAILERRADGYYITDMNSANGTYLNANKLPVNAPFKLSSGDKISFGNAGADYIWSEE